jgi:hypothetical protein
MSLESDKLLDQINQLLGDWKMDPISKSVASITSGRANARDQYYAQHAKELATHIGGDTLLCLAQRDPSLGGELLVATARKPADKIQRSRVTKAEYSVIESITFESKLLSLYSGVIQLKFTTLSLLHEMTFVTNLEKRQAKQLCDNVTHWLSGGGRRAEIQAAIK